MSRLIKKANKWIDKPQNYILTFFLTGIILYISVTLFDIYILEESVDYALLDNIWILPFWFIFPVIIVACKRFSNESNDNTEK